VILDFEGWRPLSADNDAVYPDGYTLSLYTQHSRSLVRAAHPRWTEAQITAEARSQFDAGAQEFFTATVVACKLTRPGAKVGYYGFPGMISPADTHPPSFSGSQLLWLWRQLDVLTPSNYLWTAFAGREVERAAVNVGMALALADLVHNTTGVRPLVMPYIWIWPTPLGGLNGSSSSPPSIKPARGLDLAASVTVPAAMGADGVILCKSCVATTRSAA
jgi:hypothetical protein